MGGNSGWEKGEGFSGTSIKDTWTKPKGVESRVGSGEGWDGGSGGRNMETIVLKQQFKKIKLY